MIDWGRMTLSDEYLLFLDESETHINNSSKVFCIAGIIIKDVDYPIIISELNNLKRLIWNDLSDPLSVRIHQKEIREANNGKRVSPEFLRFKKNLNCRLFYTELNKIFQLNLISIIGCCIIMDNLDQFFHSDIITDKYLIGMQMVLENYCHFLHRNNGVSSIFYESLEEPNDKEIRMRFNLIKAMGSMFVNSYSMQRYLKDISFPTKSQNIHGMQLADFVPNDFARKANGLKRHKYDIYDNTRRLRYNGGIEGKEDRFGIKIMP